MQMFVTSTCSYTAKWATRSVFFFVYLLFFGVNVSQKKKKGERESDKPKVEKEESKTQNGAFSGGASVVSLFLFFFFCFKHSWEFLLSSYYGAFFQNPLKARKTEVKKKKKKIKKEKKPAGIKVWVSKSKQNNNNNNNWKASFTGAFMLARGSVFSFLLLFFCCRLFLMLLSLVWLSKNAR